MRVPNRLPDDLSSRRVLPTVLAAAYTGNPIRTWRRLEKEGSLPARIRLSARRFGYRVEDLDRWLESRRDLPRVA